jgi:hypothetical protein
MTGDPVMVTFARAKVPLDEQIRLLVDFRHGSGQARLGRGVAVVAREPVAHPV